MPVGTIAALAEGTTSSRLDTCNAFTFLDQDDTGHTGSSTSRAKTKLCGWNKFPNDFIMLIMADNRQVIDGGREIDSQSIVNVCFGCSLIEATISPTGQDVTRFSLLCHSTTARLSLLAFGCTRAHGKEIVERVFYLKPCKVSLLYCHRLPIQSTRFEKSI